MIEGDRNEVDCDGAGPAWAAVEGAAFLGTARCAALRAIDGAPGGLIAQLEGLDAESRVLSAAGILWAYEAAGAVPSLVNAPSPEPSPDRDDPAASACAGAHLLALLGGQHADALGEWIDTAARNGLRAPELTLPSLLDFARKRREWRPRIARVLGGRGRWLASRNPDWRYAVQVDDATSFAEASHEARVQTIATLRAKDPEKARALVESTWKEEAPERRADLLRALSAGLSMADEPFLEARLADRRKEVRTAAAELLSRLVESRLSQRMVERVQPLLAFKTSTFLGFGGARIEAKLPEACDGAMARDGIEPRRPHERIGEKAWWLLQILGAVPLGHWREAWRAPAPQIVEALAGNAFEEAIFEGWLLAAERQGDVSWAQALLLHWPPKRPELLARTLNILLEPQREIEVLRRLEENLDSSAMIHPIRGLFAFTDFPWGPALGRAVLAFLRRYALQEDKLEPGALEELILRAAYRLPPELASEASAGWPLAEHLPGGVRRALDQFFAVIDFRARALKELNRDERPATVRRGGVPK